MSTEQTTPDLTPIPIGTIYRDASGGFRIVSSLTSPRDLTRVLVALTASMVEQLADPAKPAPLVIDHDVVVKGSEDVTIQAEHGAGHELPGMPTDADNAPSAEAG